MCNLKCVFCQNWDTSQQDQGENADAKTLASMMLELQARGCHNINWVTPEHVAPQALEAMPYAIERGLRLPIVYNTSACDSLHTLSLMDGLVDIYMPDFKYWEPGTASRLLKARDYPAVARAAIAEMHRQVGDLECDASGLARRGLLVRHLVMPGALNGARHICAWLAALSPNTYLNLMDQYHPDAQVLARPEKYGAIDRPLRHDEHMAARYAAEKAGNSRFDERQRLPWRARLRVV